MTQEKKNGKIIAIITMIFLFGMISFVTNLAAPMGIVLKNQFDVSNALGMLGNFGNFIAYAVMGIPSGILLQRVGYKKTALIPHRCNTQAADDAVAPGKIPFKPRCFWQEL